MRVYRFLNEEFAIKTIKGKKLKISNILDLMILLRCFPLIYQIKSLGRPYINLKKISQKIMGLYVSVKVGQIL
jgi:hypothetical protein